MDQNYEEDTLWSRIKGPFLELFEFVAVVGVIVLIVHYFIAEPHQVSGSSMFPTYHNGEYIITNKLATKYSPIHRYEVVIFNSPRDPGKVFIKRVIGLPGETVMIKDGKVYINNSILAEPYLPQGLMTSTGSFLTEGTAVTVSANEYLVLGDNRPASSDSREWGFVPKQMLIGQAWFRYFPFNKAGLL